ncbi:MAG: bifunctional demethylmenaquinone methyltransferase/2-methoxy-6-polyprenyl-1,4-benzoquinol methylase UbiE [Acidobacteria bacterium]|nr:bifunctional demethylmenaquinone methyltransferase/2-methoxy-6-polyprenyl-1,4-benzoquinol methylase UbiE [Acidobacteriota bacterium]
MFASIAPRYDLLNHLLSLSVDRLWRRRLVRQLNGLNPSGLILDVCTGTADLAIELARKGNVVGIDFCHPMLVIGRDKVRSRKLAGRIRLAEGDALCLPFATGAFDAVTVAFGVRNLEELQRGLQEFFRVLRPGGTLAILEFSRPVVPVFREIFQFYFDHIVPLLGRAVSGREGPYRYLPESVRKFPNREDFCRILRQCGFEGAANCNLSGGIAALYTASKPLPRDRINCLLS